jgi:polar amino acid transport system substrate-binding protein
MKKVWSRIVSVLCLALVVPGAVYAGPALDRILQRKELIVGITGNQPPLNATTKEGQIIGLDADLATYMAAAMGVKLSFSPMPFAELLPALLSGKVDMVISGMSISPDRNLKVAFVGPYFVSGKSIVTKAEKADSLSSPADLAAPDIKIVALEGSTSQTLVKTVIPAAQLQTTTDYDKALALVIEGKVDAMVADFPFCALAVLRNPEKKLATLDEPFTFEPLGIALPGDDPLLINWVQNYLMTLEGSAGLQTMVDRWFKDASWLSRLP